MFEDFNPTTDENAVLTKAGSKNMAEAAKYGYELAKALEVPLRKGILPGNILGNIFQVIPTNDITTPEFPLHFLSPGSEREFVAFTVPAQGYIPSMYVEGDKVMIPTYEVGCGMGVGLDYLRFGRWDIMGGLMETLHAQVVKKLNDDGYHTLLAGAVDRNILVYDTDASAGQFTKRVLSLAKIVMRRNGGGNSTSQNRSQLTDVKMSPEAMEDIRNWGVDQIDEVTRKEIFNASDESGVLNRIFGVNLETLDEFGVGQEYNQYYINELSGTFPSGDTELMLGLDLSKRDSFVMPKVYDLELHDDPTRLRYGTYEIWGKMRVGFGLLDNRRVMALSL